MDVFSGGLGNSLRDVFSVGFWNPANLLQSTGHKAGELQTWNELWCTGNEIDATGFRKSLKEIKFRKEASSVFGCDVEPLSKKHTGVSKVSIAFIIEVQQYRMSGIFSNFQKLKTKAIKSFENVVIFFSIVRRHIP